MFDIGPSLREARTKRGLTPEDVQKAIRIRDRYLHALEEENWDLLPGDAYVKGFLRTYAEFLGLNGNLYVDEFTTRFGRREEERFVPEAMTPIGTGRVGLLRPLAAIVAIVAIVGAVAAWQLHGSGGGQTPSSSQLEGNAAAATPPSTHAKHRSKPAAKPAVARNAVLVAARGRVWLLVRSGGPNGAKLFDGFLEHGKSLPVSLAHAVWFRVGAPWNLDVQVGGKVVGGLPSQPGNLLLTSSGLSPAS